MEATERFAELMATPEMDVAVDEVALLIAAHARADLDLSAERHELELLAEGCHEATVAGVRDHLFVELGFRGDRRDYYDPRNSYLDAVVRRRLGIPITLAVLTIGVARRRDVPLSGIGMPGHFLVGDDTSPDHYLDVFDGGASLDTQGCVELYRSLHGEHAPFLPAYLHPVGAHAIAARMLNNLRSVFEAQRDHRGLVWVLRLRSMVPGVSSDERLGLAGALTATGEFAEAARELDLLAAQHSDPGQATELARQADRLRVRLN